MVGDAAGVKFATRLKAGGIQTIGIFACRGPAARRELKLAMGNS